MSEVQVGLRVRLGGNELSKEKEYLSPFKLHLSQLCFGDQNRDVIIMVSNHTSNIFINIQVIIMITCTVTVKLKIAAGRFV